MKNEMCLTSLNCLLSNSPQRTRVQKTSFSPDFSKTNEQYEFLT